TCARFDIEPRVAIADFGLGDSRDRELPVFAADRVLAPQGQRKARDLVIPRNRLAGRPGAQRQWRKQRSLEAEAAERSGVFADLRRCRRSCAQDDHASTKNGAKLWRETDQGRPPPDRRCIPSDPPSLW